MNVVTRTETCAVTPAGDSITIKGHFTIRCSALFSGRFRVVRRGEINIHSLSDDHRAGLIKEPPRRLNAAQPDRVNPFLSRIRSRPRSNSRHRELELSRDFSYFLSHGRRHTGRVNRVIEINSNIQGEFTYTTNIYLLSRNMLEPE